MTTKIPDEKTGFFDGARKRFGQAVSAVTGGAKKGAAKVRTKLRNRGERKEYLKGKKVGGKGDPFAFDNSKTKPGQKPPPAVTNTDLSKGKGRFGRFGKLVKGSLPVATAIGTVQSALDPGGTIDDNKLTGNDAGDFGLGTLRNIGNAALLGQGDRIAGLLPEFGGSEFENETPLNKTARPITTTDPTQGQQRQALGGRSIDEVLEQGGTSPNPYNLPKGTGFLRSSIPNEPSRFGPQGPQLPTIRDTLFNAPSEGPQGPAPKVEGGEQLRGGRSRALQGGAVAGILNINNAVAAEEGSRSRLAAGAEARQQEFDNRKAEGEFGLARRKQDLEERQAGVEQAGERQKQLQVEVDFLDKNPAQADIAFQRASEEGPGSQVYQAVAQKTLRAIAEAEGSTMNEIFGEGTFFGQDLAFPGTPSESLARVSIKDKVIHVDDEAAVSIENLPEREAQFLILELDRLKQAGAE